MKFNKKLLCIAISAATAGLSAGVQAAPYNIDSVNPALQTLTYAGELKQPTKNALTDTGGTGDEQNFTGILNPNAVPNATDVRLTITLSNGAKFTNPPSMASISDVGQDGIAGTADDNVKAFAIFNGGAGTSSVTFNGNAGYGFTPGQVFNVTLDGVTVANHDPVSATVLIQVADNFGATTIKTVPNLPYIAFANALSQVCSTTPISTPYNLIDVSQLSKFFNGATGDTNTGLGTIQLAFASRLNANSSPIASADTILSNLSVTLNNTGGWSPLTVADGVATYVASGPNDFVDATNTPSAYATVRDVIATTTGLVPMSVGSVSATFLGTATADFDATSANQNCSISSLAKNGSSDRLTFLLTPKSEGGVFAGFVRISNPSPVSGNVFLKLTNDKGVSVPFPLSAVAGLPAAIAAGSSTPLISMDQLLAAAKTVNPAFTALVDTNGDGILEKGKLRLDADAEFGEGTNNLHTKSAWTGSDPTVASTTGVNLQSLSTSTDNKAFFSTQPE